MNRHRSVLALAVVVAAASSCFGSFSLSWLAMHWQAEATCGTQAFHMYIFIAERVQLQRYNCNLSNCPNFQVRTIYSIQGKQSSCLKLMQFDQTARLVIIYKFVDFTSLLIFTSARRFFRIGPRLVLPPLWPWKIWARTCCFVVVREVFSHCLKEIIFKDNNFFVFLSSAYFKIINMNDATNTL